MIVIAVVAVILFRGLWFAFCTVEFSCLHTMIQMCVLEIVRDKTVSVNYACFHLITGEEEKSVKLLLVCAMHCFYYYGSSRLCY